MAATATALSEAHVELKKTRRFYAPELDLLRFFAFLLVFTRHVITGFGIAKQQAAQASAGSGSSIAARPYGSHLWSLLQDFAQSLDFGVCLFFFLSSFLITSLLLIERRVTGTVDVKGFYVRRGLRIWPLYFVFLAVMGALAPFQPWLHITFPRMIASLLFVANWPVVLHGWAGSPIEPLWSVSVEEQFYLVWPQFARFGRNGVVAVSVFLALLPFVIVAWIGGHPPSQNTTMWANSLVQCLFFAGGALTAIIAGSRSPSMGVIKRMVLFAGGWACWLMASAACHVVRTSSPGVFSLLSGYALVLAGTLLIFIACLGWKPAWMPKGFYSLGRITYGLYVFHFLWLELVTILVQRMWSIFGLQAPSLIVTYSLIAVTALGATIACSTLSYSLLERPFLKMKERFTVIPSRPT